MAQAGLRTKPVHVVGRVEVLSGGWMSGASNG
ncbi:hypothetical protein SAMN04489742_4127 [Arthrobacter crystallopoietes]|uniref:Uncharacterized protein n=1 Tax=Crystallibacter crystallopoietes TaxID=37928 RepID=A0A1H1GJQ8_9MICC|nr:hypothetical protein SAMN04489742_4127 [Arthrobacter crystallopoietes]